MHHIWHGLDLDGLIEGQWRFGDQTSLKAIFLAAPASGIVCQPSALGAELFLWAFGYGKSPLESLFSTDLDTAVDDLPSIVPGAVATKGT